MITLVIGGSGSGKSDYAESLLDSYSNKKVYLATMQIYDDETHKKVERHRRRRAGKGFETVEMPVDVNRLAPVIKDDTCAVLLECVSNLVANEMFCGDEVDTLQADDVAAKILDDISEISKLIDEFVIVTNNVAEDGIVYDDGTMAYIKAISDVNIGLAGMADRVVEVVVGIPVTIKGERQCQ